MAVPWATATRASWLHPRPAARAPARTQCRSHDRLWAPMVHVCSQVSGPNTRRSPWAAGLGALGQTCGRSCGAWVPEGSCVCRKSGQRRAELSGVCSAPAGGRGLGAALPRRAAGLAVRRGPWLALTCSLPGVSIRATGRKAGGLGVSLWLLSTRCQTDLGSQDSAGAAWSPATAVNIPGGLRSKDEGGLSRAGHAGLGWSSGVSEIMGVHLCLWSHLVPPGWVLG